MYFCMGERIMSERGQNIKQKKSRKDKKKPTKKIKGEKDTPDQLELRF
jgi:hypothetical protein